MYFFKLRKDLTNINNQQEIYKLQIAAYIEQINTLKARNYVNYLLDVDKTLTTTITEKADVSYVNNTVASMAIIPSNISETINSYVEQAINIINTEKQNAINEINEINIYSYQGASGNNSLPLINNSLDSAILQLNNHRINALEEINYEKNKALFEINVLSDNVANQINGLNNSVKQDLLKRIDYLFEMFYHANSEIIIQLYPI